MSVVASYAPSDGGWVVTAVPSGTRANAVPEAVAFGRTLERARVAIVSALARSRQTHSGNVAVTDRVSLSPGPERALAEARAARDAALLATAASNAATSKAVLALASQGLALRDIGYLLGLSHARIHQLLAKDSDA